jgi:hypothetical protein
MKREDLVRDHRERTHKLTMIHLLVRVMREHVGPRVLAEATDKKTAVMAIESVTHFVQAWESAERYGVEQAAKRLEYGRSPDEWSVLEVLGLHD